MTPSDIARLTTFVAVAERGSFARAADSLGRRTSTVSHTIRALEETLQVRLFNRTTRSVVLTEAGEQLLGRVQPLLAEMGAALDALDDFRSGPRGRLRLSVSSLALSLVVATLLRSFTKAYPDVTLEVTVDEESGDLAEGREDAGIRSLPRIPKDMITTRVGSPGRLVAIASPDYLRRCGEPRAIADLAQHNCLVFRYASGATYRWEMIDAGRKVEAPVRGTVVTDNADFIVRAALDGVGIGYILEDHVRAHVEAGRLVVVLEPHALPFEGWFLYYPSRRNMPGALKAFVDFVRKSWRAPAADLALAG